MSGSRIKEIGSGQTRDGKSERRNSRNQCNGLEEVNLIQMTIIYTPVESLKNPFKNSLNEME